MAGAAVIPPPPPGFVLDGAGDVPPPPPGFTLDRPLTRVQGADAALQRGTVGVGEAAANLATGSVAAPIAGLVGLGQGIKNLVSPGMPAGDRVRQVQNAMTFDPQTSTGQAVSGVIAAPFEKLAEGADAAGGAVTDFAGKVLPAPAAAAIGAGVNTGIQALPMIAGRYAAPAARRAAALAAERADVATKLGQPHADAVLKAKDAGYVLSPAEANPNLLNRVLEGFSGQAKVQQLASTKNQPITNAIVRKGLGIEKDTPISVEVLQDVRKEAGKTYEKVRNVGEVPIDEQYHTALDKIVEKYEGASKSFPDEASAVQKAVDSARKTVNEGSFDASAGVDKIKIERARGDKAFRQGDTELGKAHKAIADAIEQQIERRLESGGTSAIGGQADLLAEFQKSRQIIAKSYDVQKALKGNDVDARVLAAQLRKAPGRITGEIRQAAEFGGRFPGAAQTGGKNAYVPVSYFDALAGGGAGVGAFLHSPEMALAAAAAVGATALRPGIRAGITSGPYQRAFVNPPTHGAGMAPTLAAILSSNPAAAAGSAAQAHGYRTLEEELRKR